MEVASEPLTLFAGSAWLTEVLVALATIPRDQQFERVGPLILQVILDQFDPASQGMVVKLIQCVRPAVGRPVRSARLTHAVGNVPSDQDMLPSQLYLAGRESLPGQVLTSRRAVVVEDAKQDEGLPRPANGWVKSTIMVPLLFGTQVAGCLAICSPLPHSFRLPQVELLQQYAILLALTFPSEAFYTPEQIALSPTPSPEIQRPLAPRFQTLLMHQLTEANLSQQSAQARVEAERLAWQRIEEEVIALVMSPSGEPVQPDTASNVPTHTSQALALQQSQLHDALPTDQSLPVPFQKQHPFDELKERVLIALSHELRTPLTIVGGYLDLLQAYGSQMDQEQIWMMLSQAQKGYHGLVSVVNTITEAVATGGQFSVKGGELLQVKEIIQEVMGRFDAAQVHAYTIELCISDTLQVWADRQALEQVVYHLLSNVFKYVPRQTPVTIAARLLELTSCVCISVQDVGPGIPPEEIPWLFERFARLRRDVTSAVPGMGLGLFISKRLVEAMGGQIWVESSGQASAGCCLCFTLPAQPPLPLQSSSSPSVEN